MLPDFMREENNLRDSKIVLQNYINPHILNISLCGCAYVIDSWKPNVARFMWVMRTKYIRAIYIIGELGC